MEWVGEGRLEEIFVILYDLGDHRMFSATELQMVLGVLDLEEQKEVYGFVSLFVPWQEQLLG